MILRLRNDGNVIEHSEKTVKDLIDNNIYKTKEK